MQLMAGVAAMVAELSDRFGKPPEAVEHLLYVALVRSLGRSANRRADIVFFGAADKSPLR